MSKQSRGEKGEQKVIDVLNKIKAELTEKLK